MHPEDLAIYLSSIDGEPEGVQLRPDETMARGDTTLQMDDTAVDDLIAHRLERLANHIFGIEHGFTDEVFRTPLRNESDTEAAFTEINDYIEHEIVDAAEVMREEKVVSEEEAHIQQKQKQKQKQKPC